MRRVRFQIDFTCLEKKGEGRATGIGGEGARGRQLLENKAMETLCCREREIATRTEGPEESAEATNPPGQSPSAIPGRQFSVSDCAMPSRLVHCALVTCALCILHLYLPNNSICPGVIQLRIKE